MVSTVGISPYYISQVIHCLSPPQDNLQFTPDGLQNFELIFSWPIFGLCVDVEGVKSEMAGGPLFK